MGLTSTRVDAALGGFSVLGIIQDLAVAYLSPNPDTDANPQAGQWRPPQWANNIPSYTMLSASDGGNSTYYFFDAVFRTEHTSELRITEHPVQTGANISDHAYQIPYRLVMQIGMSDTMDSYQAGAWSDTSGKSVAAYQALIGLQQSRALLSITTRLTNYSNMLIESIRSDDTAETQYGLKAIVTFRQVLFATANQTTTQRTQTSSTILGYDVQGTKFDGNGNPIPSGRPDSTDSTSVGTVQTASPSPAVLSQHKITSSQYNGIPGYPNFASPSSLSGVPLPSIPGAGTWSGNNLANLPNVFNVF